MKNIPAAVLIASFALALGGCHRDIQNTEAVRQGVLKYLAKRQDLSAMDVSVNSVSFRSNEADAVVHFQAKSNTAVNAGLDIKYVLERKGNEWVVKGRSGMGTGANPHGGAAAGASPHGDMGTGGGGGLPPGHPPLTPPASK